MAVEAADPGSKPGATGEDVESPDWNSIAWGVAKLLSTAFVAALVGLLVVEVTLRLKGVIPPPPGFESVFDLDGETAGVFQAGSQVQDQWKRGATFRASFNSWGMRGDEPRESPRPRILAVGDSNTFGYGVEDDETWPAQLDRRLAEAGHPRPVLNLSTVGFMIDDQLRYLEATLPAYRPDIVILMPLPNGYALTPGAETYHQRKMAKERRVRSVWIGWTQNTAIESTRRRIQRWRKTLALEAAAVLLTTGGLDTPNASDGVRDDSRAELELRRRYFAERLGVLRARLDESGARLLVVLLPEADVFIGGSVSDPSWVDRLGQRSWVDRLAREEGIPLVDISERLAADSDPTSLILGVGDTHPSARAQRLIAAAVGAELERLGWLE
jgi:lysophospholipase L1-like esterase